MHANRESAVSRSTSRALRFACSASRAYPGSDGWATKPLSSRCTWHVVTDSKTAVTRFVWFLGMVVILTEGW